MIISPCFVVYIVSGRYGLGFWSNIIISPCFMVSLVFGHYGLGFCSVRERTAEPTLWASPLERLFLGQLKFCDAGQTHCHMVAVTHWERVNEFYFARLAIDTQASQEFTENDLVLLSKEKVMNLISSASDTVTVCVWLAAFPMSFAVDCIYLSSALEERTKL